MAPKALQDYVQVVIFICIGLGHFKSDVWVSICGHSKFNKRWGKMSHYVTPFLVLNLGSEMVFVIDQRLQAQNVSRERSALVLEELISGLIGKPLITELMKPQATYNHETVRRIVEDVTQSSTMRLDPVSMSKLWDLISMVFKWQATISDQIIDITLRHLYEIETYVTSEHMQLELHRVQNIIENFNKILDKNEKSTLHQDVLYWLKDFNVRVSLLLRMGLQNMDGNFVVNNLDPIAENMLKNLGENVYQVSKNGRILENRHGVGSEIAKQEENVNELQLFVDEMLGERKLSTGSTEGNGNILKLAINDENSNNTNDKSKINFDNIDVDIDDKKLQELMVEMTVKDEVTETTFRDDLLEMIGDNKEDEV